jgi:hypothetical protein
VNLWQLFRIQLSFCIKNVFGILWLQIYNIENAYYNLSLTFLSKFTIFQLKIIKIKTVIFNYNELIQIIRINLINKIREFVAKKTIEQ